MRARVARVGALMYERRLTDAAGGNITARVGDLLCMTPRYSGSKYNWQLRPEDVLVVDLDANILDGTGELSRESLAHFRLHREFGEHGKCVIHAHARNVLVFAALNRPMPATLEQMRKFGEVPVIPFAPSHSGKLAEHIADTMRGNEARIRKQAMCVIAPWHGLFVMGKDLDAAYDAVERMDTNAHIVLMARQWVGDAALDAALAQMEESIANFKE
jgi:L-fuculose-phosphate aldolase